MTRICPECGDKIIGREDKKFCGDSCRSAFNNRQNKDTSNLMRNINNRLRRNYRILCDVNIAGKTSTSRNELIRKGFDFTYFTTIRRTRKGNTYYFLYDQAYLLSGNDRYVLIRKSP